MDVMRVGQTAASTAANSAAHSVVRWVDWKAAGGPSRETSMVDLYVHRDDGDIVG